MASNVQYSDYDSKTKSRAQYLQNQLSIVDRAINQMGMAQGSATVRLPSDVLKDPSRTSSKRKLGPSSYSNNRQMRSHSQGSLLHQAQGSSMSSDPYKIDTMSVQLGTCPHCLAEMDSKKLRIHISQLCPNKEIVCPEANCGCVFNLKHLRRHIQSECVVAKARKSLLEHAAQRKKNDKEECLTVSLEETSNSPLPQSPATEAQVIVTEDEEVKPGSTGHFIVCWKCNEGMKASQLPLHLSECCVLRTIMCPNIHRGCDQKEIPLKQLQSHLLNDCKAEKKRQELIEKSKLRREEVVCSGCGELVPILFLKRHESELCENRRVHCRNHALGCNVMVRMRERSLHELVDGRKQTRSSFYTVGHGVNLSIGEDDIKGSWTTEFWINRPPAKDAFKSHMCDVFLQLDGYCATFEAEIALQEQVSSLVSLLKNGQAFEISEEQSKQLSKEEKNALKNQSAQRKLDLVNQLTPLVDTYSDAVLKYMKVFQKVAISLEMAKAALKEAIVDSRGISLSLNLVQPFPGISSDFDSISISPAVIPSSKLEIADDLTSANSNGNDIRDEAFDGDNLSPESGSPLITSGFLPVTLASGSTFSKFISYCISSFDPDGQQSVNKVTQKFPFSDNVREIILQFGLDEFVSNLYRRSDLAYTVCIKALAWSKLLAIFTNCLRQDLTLLQRARIAAGLLKSEEKANLSRGNTAKTIALTEEEEKNLKIKEIARKKREMKKQKTLREKALQMEAEDSVPASHRTGVVHETKSVTKEKLISRITQQFKGGCTGEILAQSTTVNSLGYRNSICSNIYSGLTVLLARDEGEELDDFYHEMFPELLIKESEMSALIKCHSKVGLVCATPPSSGFGVEVKSFGASLSRLNWVHIAFVGTESPTNRVTLYLDGYLVKQLKDCAFPLPMGSALGPADSLSSFQGAAIDMRYWYTPRSAVQIKDTMHRLLEFHEPISASNTGKNKSKAKEKDMVNLSTDGLIGWWTFEDGPGSVEVTDVTSHRFKTKVTKHLLESVGHTTKKGDIRKTISSFLKKQFNRSSWKWVDADSVPIREAVIGGAQDSGLPLPSYRMRGLCPFEIKRYRLAKSGRELHREIDCPLGCGVKIRFLDKRLHCKYECIKRLVRCRFEFCGALFCLLDRDEHEKTQCSVTLSRNDILLKAVEKDAAIFCPLCSMKSTHRQIRKHMSQECMHRRVKCPFPDCFTNSTDNETTNEDGNKTEESVKEDLSVESERSNSPQTGMFGIAAVDLPRHLRYECTSAIRKRRFLLIERARQRINYPRPWGIEIEEDMN